MDTFALLPLYTEIARVVAAGVSEGCNPTAYSLVHQLSDRALPVDKLFAST